MRRINKIIIYTIVAVLLLGSSFSFINSVCLADSNVKTSRNNVVLVLINQLSFTQELIYKNLEGFKRLESDAAKGAMNVNSAGSRTDANSYFSIGIGSKGSGIREIGNNYEALEIVHDNGDFRAIDLYLQQTGEQLNKNQNILLPIEKLYEEKQKFPVKIGALGETLESNGIMANVYGNSDTINKIRYAPLITMNNKGVSYGRISEKTTVKDLTRPYGIKTNYPFMLQELNKKLSEKGQLVVFDLGDLYRLEKFKKEMTEEYELEVRKKIFMEMGVFLKEIINRLSETDILIVASPMVTSEAENVGKILSPIWIYEGTSDGSIIYSNTTKREGIVTNIDLAPTILKYFNIDIKPVEMLGNPLMIKKSHLNLEKELNHAAIIYKLRHKVLYTYVMWQVVLLILATIIWISKWKRLYTMMQIGLLSMLFSPLLFLITAFWTPKGAYFYVFTIILISIIMTVILYRLKLTIFLMISSLTTYTTIIFDTWLGSPLMKRSFLGYDPIIGARYYGIGNEYMGVLIGATLLLSSILYNLNKKRATLISVGIFFIFTNFVLIYPTLGTNAGGAIASIIATGFILLRYSGVSLSRKGFVYILLLVGTGLIMLIGFNYYAPQQSQSHIGRALNQLLSGDIIFIYQTIQRKVAMNWKLIQVSSWSKVLISSLIAIGILFIKPRRTFKEFLKGYPYLLDSSFGIIIGALTALLVNDSGIVAASTMIIYLAIPLLYIGLQK